MRVDFKNIMNMTINAAHIVNYVVSVKSDCGAALCFSVN